MNELIRLADTIKRVLISLVGPSATRKSQFLQTWLKIGNFNSKFAKVYFFYQHSLPLYVVRQKEVENVNFVQVVNFDVTDSLKNNGTKYLVIFDDSIE